MRQTTGRCIAIALALALAAGCEQEVDEGRIDSGAADGAVADRSTDSPKSDLGDAAPAEQRPPDAPAGETVKVSYGGVTETVALSQPSPVTFDGTPHARLSDVVALAFPSAALSGLEADFESGDGYRPSSKSNCDGLVPVAGDLFGKGYIDVATRRLAWDPDLQYPGCLSVKDLAEILLSDR